MTDGESSEFQLHEDFDDAAQQDQPEQCDAGLSFGFCGHNQFAGADDIGGNDQSGPDMLQDLEGAAGGICDFGGDTTVGVLRVRRL